MQTKTAKQGTNKTYQKVHVKRADLDTFKSEATAYLNNLSQAPEANTTKLESEIDRLVYELYGLSEEEVGVVEGE